MKTSWKRWKLGVCVSVGMSVFVALAALTGSANWKAVLAVFGAACLTHVGTWLTAHPVDSISFSDKDDQTPNPS